MTLEYIDELIQKNRKEFIELKKERDRLKIEADIEYFKSIVGKFFYCEQTDKGYESFVKVKKENEEVVFYEVEVDNDSDISCSVDFSKQKLSELNIGKTYFELNYLEIDEDLFLNSVTKLNKFIKEAIQDV